ncbi:class I SAM-dependent DNA methyltransferase [Evansella sp. AB-rgal1]|uniref:HsdM family class I SAM-dependent methyltransferase n=1 Tax=Evansella sp. AB-rgal1 TaxID=3242696 RepID=UPI00359E405B
MVKQFDLVEWFEEKKTKKQQMLGQVYTPKHIADYMAELVLSLQPKKVLDPCFGKGIFIDSLLEKGMDSDSIVGVEVDPFSFREYKDIHPSLHLENSNFFDFHRQVDCVIMNPPYVRQENLTSEMPDFLNKKFLQDKIKECDIQLSARSNLYLYFFIKAWSILEEKGSIIAIVPNTWAVADYGSEFKRFLLDYFQINRFISFEKDVFPDADVESCILHLTKLDKNENLENHEMSFVTLSHKSGSFLDMDEKVVRRYKQKDLHESMNWLTIFHKNDLWEESAFVPLESIASINRGIGTNSNSTFITEPARFKDYYSEFFQAIVCSPKDVAGYTTKKLVKEDVMFFTDVDKESLPQELGQYIEEQERNIVAEQTPKTLYEKIVKSPNSWYKFKARKAAPILFSYIIRKNKKFICNEKNVIARDNFYEIHVHDGVDACLLFSILNSGVTSYFLENMGRSHGNGLLKIQKYELDILSVVNPSLLSMEDKMELISYGKKLMDENNPDFIDKIDSVLLSYVSSDLTVDELRSLLAEKVKERLSKKKV